MISPVSGTGRAMMASLQQAMSKGMPVDQAIAYVKSMAQQGVAPLTDLYAMLNQFQRLKQPPARPPIGATIRDQIAQESAGRAAQEAMSQGIAGLDAGTLETAQYAGGGIVAFADGGLTDQEESELAALKQLKQEIGAAAASAGSRREFATPYTPAPEAVSLYSAQRTRLAELERKKVEAEKAAETAKRSQAMIEEAKRRGLSYVPPGAPAAAPVVEKKPEVAAPARRQQTPAERRVSAEAAPVAAKPAERTLETDLAEIERLQKSRGIGTATDKAMQLLAQEEADFKAQAAKDRSLALAQAGFRMAREAAKPGATFTGALGAGGEEYVKGTQELSKASREFQRNLNRERINLEKSKELLAAGNIEAAIKLRESSLDRIEKEKDRQSRTALTMFTARLEQEGRLATIDASDRATMARLLGDASTAYTNGLAQLQMSPDYIDADEATKTKMRKQLEDATYNRLVGGVFGDGSYVPSSGENPYTGFKATQLSK
jgi:hypothetical protein